MRGGLHEVRPRNAGDLLDVVHPEGRALADFVADRAGGGGDAVLIGEAALGAGLDLERVGLRAARKGISCARPLAVLPGGSPVSLESERQAEEGPIYHRTFPLDQAGAAS
jgi:hypothetical protein